jgi:hypothetical protein
MGRVLMSPCYWDWVRSEAALIDTDGCSLVTGLKIECCFEHDLGFWYARDPRAAYRAARHQLIDPWLTAPSIDRAEVDRRFRSCLQNRSRLGRWSPMAWYRWLGVKFGSQGAWDRHRTREQEEATFV